MRHRTAKLLLMYMTMVSILRTFTRAGRTGNWLLYRQALQPYLASAGHHNYTKSLFLYLTQMKKLQDIHSRVYSKFVDGFFVFLTPNQSHNNVNKHGRASLKVL